MIDAITGILGEYVQLAGDGIASLNLTWVVGAIAFLMSLWVFYKVLLKFFDWLLK